MSTLKFRIIRVPSENHPEISGICPLAKAYIQSIKCVGDLARTISRLNGADFITSEWKQSPNLTRPRSTRSSRINWIFSLLIAYDALFSLRTLNENGRKQLTEEPSLVKKFKLADHYLSLIFVRWACMFRPASVRRYFCLLLFGLSGMVISIKAILRAGSR